MTGALLQNTVTRRSDGYLERGASPTRPEAFVDAAFAFAVTLLVISLNSVPDSMPAMLTALKGVPAFAASFAQIMMFWAAHATWSRRFGLDDSGSNGLSMLLVFLVLVYVYPLKIMFGSFFAWISGGWLPPVADIGSLRDLQLMFVMYSIAFGTLSLCQAALNQRALRVTLCPPLEPVERGMLRGEIARWIFYALIAALSITLAFMLPEGTPNWMYGMPGMVYALLGFTGVVMTRFERTPALA